VLLLLLLQKKAKKKKKPRYPKGYDPSQPNGGLPLPDPERWLPKWQRSDFKKKQKRRRDRTVGALQILGMVVMLLHKWQAGNLHGPMVACSQGQTLLSFGVWVHVPGLVSHQLNILVLHAQETVKGSQGAGKVDEALDRTKAAAAEEQKGASSSKPQLPARQGSKKGGKR
jgi:hypothetical protein